MPARFLTAPVVGCILILTRTDLIELRGSYILSQMKGTIHTMTLEEIRRALREIRARVNDLGDRL